MENEIKVGDWIRDREGHKVINISYLSKKEREEVINKRNCLLVQKATYQEILSLLEKE